MHYPDESYVRKYTRKTSTNRMLKWQGRAVMDAMLGEFDRAGIFELAGDAVECISAVTDIPEDIVRFGLERLVSTRTWTVTPTAIVWPTYVEAQTCAKSDRVRQQESRKRRALEAAGGEASRTVEGHESHAVTSRHEPSRDVTPSLSYPSSADPISLPEERRDYLSEPRPEPEPELAAAPPAQPAAPAARALQQRWRSYPKGWRGWSIQTASAAVAQELTTSDLAGHVDYWSTRAFPGGDVDDLDFELRRSIPDIAARKRKAASASSTSPPAATSPPAPDPYRWAPNNEHRAIAKRFKRDLRHPVEAYRAARMPERIGTTFRVDEDFKRRLRWWCEHGGEFPATGKLSPFEAARLPKAVGA